MALASLGLRRALARAAAAAANHRRPLPAIAASPLPLIASAAAALRPLPGSVQSFRSSAPLADRRYDQENDSKIDPNEILFEGCDYNHWLITMDFPTDPAPSREDMIEAYIQTLAKVVGSVEEAKKRMYALSTTTYHGFQAVMTEEMSEKFRGLPGVVFILPDSYIDPVNKEYGGDKYENGVITPRPPPMQYNNRKPRQRYDDRNDRPNYNRPPQGQGNMGRDQGMMQNDGRNYAPQQNYNPNMQDGSRNFGPGDRRGPMPPNQRDFQGNQGNFQGNQGSFQGNPGNFVPRNQGFGQQHQGNFAPQNQRTFDNAAGYADGPGYDRQGPAPGYGVDNRQHHTQGYGGENRQGGFEHANAYGQGPDSAHGQQNYSGYEQGQSGSWQGRQ